MFSIQVQVSGNSFSSQYLSKGDEIVRIEGIDASLFTEAEASSFITKPSKSLDLVILKRSKELSDENASNTRYRKQVPPAAEKISKRRSANEKRKMYNYKRSNSVPSKYSSTCDGVPTYQLEYIISNEDRNYRWNAFPRDQSASPPICDRNTAVDLNRGPRFCSDFRYNERANETHRGRNSRRFWKQMEIGVSDMECDQEVAQYCTSRKDRWHARRNSVDSLASMESTTAATTTDNDKDFTDTSREYRYKIRVQFDDKEKYEREVRSRQLSNNRNTSRYAENHQKNISKIYLSPYDLQMHKNIIHSLQPLRTKNGRQTSQTPDNSSQAQPLCESSSAAIPSTCNNATPAAPPAPAPPPPPPPTINGTIPTIRLKSEISDRNEPPAKLQNAMMKDKKPFTYTPGGIDLSEIKSPRMQRRIVKNAQTPDDIVLPTPAPTLNPSSLPPSAMAAMTPQIAIPVFPQNGLPKKSLGNASPSHITQSPQKPAAIPSTQPPQKQTITPPPPPQRRSVSPTPAQQNQQPVRTIVVTNSQPKPNTQSDNAKEQPKAQIGSIYVPPVSETTSSNKPAFPTLREAPTPWLQKHQQLQEDKVPAWVNRSKNNSDTEQKEIIYERKPRVQQMQIEKEAQDSDRPVAGTRVIPIQIEGGNQNSNQFHSKPNPQRWGTPANHQTVSSNQTVVDRSNAANSNKSFNEPDSKPIQSRSFKVIQKITGSEDDTVDYNSQVPYNTEGVPLSQLRRLHLCDDDQAFMNKVKSQANGLTGGSVSVIEIKNDDFDVDEDIFLHSETDPRYRGSAIPSKAFRKLQNMTDSGQVIPITIEVQAQEKVRPISVKDTNEEPQKKYVPPSERQAEQDLRKYMGSSIPSRSFKMLQAMTSTQQSSQNTRQRNKDEDVRVPYPNPWPNPPKTLEEINLFWIHYMYLFNLVLQHLPHKIDPNIGEFYDEYSRLEFHTEDGPSDSFPENENDISNNELIIDEVVKDDSDHEVSLTVCIPLRKKSKSVEYHEEVVVEDDESACVAGVTLGSHEEQRETTEESENTLHVARSPVTSAELNSNDTKQGSLNYLECSSLSDTEHSESSSVDFWKEIATDEDEMYFKRRSLTPAMGVQRPTSPICHDVAYDENVNSEPRPTSPHAEYAVRDQIKRENNDYEIDLKHEALELPPNDDQRSTTPNAHNFDDHNVDTCITSNSTSNASDLDERFENESYDSSSDENDSYNVYEFSSNIPSQPQAAENTQPDNPSMCLLDVVARADHENDSGMSDTGIHSPDAPLGSELRKLSTYQRANTHSRLLRILQEEENDKDKRYDKSELTVRKESLTLPLTANSWLTESVSSSSGINSPLSPVVNEKLVNELVQSLLNSKRLGYHKLGPEKLREAAIRSLQPESCSDTSRACSPRDIIDKTELGACIRDVDASQVDSNDYHEISALYYPGFDIIPSRAFKNLQSGRSTPMNWPKCPLISTQSPDPPKLINTNTSTSQETPHDS